MLVSCWCMSSDVTFSTGSILFGLIECSLDLLISHCRPQQLHLHSVFYLFSPWTSLLCLMYACMFDLLPNFNLQGSWRRRWRIQRWWTCLRNRSTSSGTESSSCHASWSLYLPPTSGTPLCHRFRVLPPSLDVCAALFLLAGLFLLSGKQLENPPCHF